MMKFTQEQRNAILNAAEHIVLNPDKYDFYKVHVPWSTEGCGCVLGWISFFYGRRFYLYHRGLDATARWLGYIDAMNFYDAMRRVSRHEVGEPSWHDDSEQAYNRLMKLIDDQQAYKP